MKGLSADTTYTISIKVNYESLTSDAIMRKVTTMSAKPTQVASGKSTALSIPLTFEKFKDCSCCTIQLQDCCSIKEKW